jgi:hypothetical protein
VNRPPKRTPVLERVFHHFATALVALTGIAYFVLKDLVEPDPEAFSVLSHPWQPHAQHLHVLFAPLLVLSLGVLLRDHVLGRLRNPSRKRSRRTGWTLALSVLPMIATGYLLQVTIDEGWRSFWKWSHLATSLLFLAGYLIHALLPYRRPADA